MNILEQVPDPLKLTASVSAPVLSFFGVPVEQWAYIVSIIVSLMFIIEKIPKVIERFKSFIDWIRSKKNTSSE